MQSHLPKADTVRRVAQAAVGSAACGRSPGWRLTCQQSVLLGPVERQIEFAQPRRGERGGLPALQDRLDQLRAQKSEADEAANVAPGDAVTPGQLLEGSGTAGGELLKPRAAACNRLDQHRIASRAVLRSSRQYQLGFDAVLLEGHCCRQLDSSVTCIL